MGGYAITKDLCTKFDGIVYLTSRDEGRGKASQQELAKLGLKCNYHQLDVSDGASIDRFAAYIKNTYGGLDCLVNNAGIAYKEDLDNLMGDQKVSTQIGVQAKGTLAVNYFGVVDICKALFPLLRPHSRVVNISSIAGH